MADKMQTTLGMRIRNEREKKGIVQSTLANMVGVTQASISQIESDARRPNNEVLKKICSALDVEWDTLVNGDEEMIRLKQSIMQCADIMTRDDLRKLEGIAKVLIQR